MIGIRIAGDFAGGPLMRLLGELERPDLRPLAETLRGIMIEDNRSGLLAGTDRNGKPMAPVRQSTIDRGRGGDGPPLNPRESSSRAVADYDVEIQDNTRGGQTLIGGWRGTPFVKYHTGVDSRTGRAERNIVGIRPDGMLAVANALEDFALTLIGGTP